MAFLVKVAVLRVDITLVLTERFWKYTLDPFHKDVVNTVIWHASLSEDLVHFDQHLLYCADIILLFVHLQRFEEAIFDLADFLPVHLCMAFLVKVAVLRVDITLVLTERFWKYTLDPFRKDVVNTAIWHASLSEDLVHFDQHLLYCADIILLFVHLQRFEEAIFDLADF